MTVVELRALLAAYPDDMRVVAYGCDQGGLEDMVLKPITCVFHDDEPRGGHFDTTRHVFGRGSDGIPALLCDYTTTADDASYTALMDARSDMHTPGSAPPLPPQWYPKMLFHRLTLETVTVPDAAGEAVYLATGDYVQSPAEVGVETHPTTEGRHGDALIAHPELYPFQPVPWAAFVGLTIASIVADDPRDCWTEGDDEWPTQLTIHFTNGTRLTLEPSVWFTESSNGNMEPVYLKQGELVAVLAERERLREEHREARHAVQQRQWNAQEKQYTLKPIAPVFTLNAAADAEALRDPIEAEAERIYLSEIGHDTKG